ncbi:family 78 glycoside hydrolase catalytic domain, partial [bacterium]|nr:family 78 glycoside hydrolase catalytic domain [bacterium]
MARAKFIWNDPEGRGRNRTVLFRHSFLLDGEPAEGTLHVFADTRYRLLVNGRVLGHGPARFFTAKPEADAWDILPALEPGRNTIAVMVNSTGAWTFHSEKSVGGLIAWGEAADVAGNRVTVTTDESWRAIESPGHRPDTHYMSFALNPAERLDARRLPPDWADADYDDHEWPPAVVVARQDHWGSLHPRSIPLLDESVVRPTACLGAWAARSNPDEDVYSLLAIARHGKSLHTNARVAVLTHIHSPRDQQVTFGAWWGRYWLNGEPLERVERDDVPYRQDRTAHFHEGWNTLFVYETWGHDWWDFYLALPREAGLAVSAEREVDSPHTFLLGLWEDELAERADSLDLPFPEALPADLGPWHRWPRDRRAETPCRERAWKTFERIARPGPAAVAVRELAPRAEGASLSLLFDFGGEMLGRPVLDFTAAAGTVVDLAYTERLNADGTADVHGRYFVDMAERYVARDGRQTWQTFHPRGFRYLEVLVAGDLTAFDLHSVSLTRARYPVKHVGSFECSDPLLSEIWSLGQATLHACMEDAYLDCPWRERGLYAGDCLVEFATNLATFGDTQLLRRCIELFFLAQGESGLVPPCPHGLPPGRHPDYSAILVQCLWQYWAWTGDVGFLQDMREPLRRLLAGIEALTVEGAELLDGTDMNAYVDMAPTERGAVSCALNCFYQRAFADGARVLELVGDPAAEHYA